MFWIFWKHFLGSAETANVASPAGSGAPVASSKNTFPAVNRRRNDLSAYSNDAVCVFDDAFNLLHLSPNWESVTGLDIKKSLGAQLKERVAAEDLKKITEYFAQEDSKSPPIRFKIKLGHNGSSRWNWFEIQLALVEEDEAGEAHYKCLLRNINELVHTQTNYEKYRMEADLANKSRSEFLANMNHELRTPLNAIIGFAQMIENQVYGEIGNPKYIDYVSSIQTSGLTLLSKVNDLIDVASINAGQMLLDEKPQDIIPIIRHAIELQAHRAFTSHVTLRDNLPFTPLVASVDRIRLLQVLSNVISNAVKYNKREGTVDIYCEKRKDNGINIVVEDTGAGIAPDHLQRINSAFRQENSFFARTRDCVGIGLALSKEIVKLHKGKIEIESEPGKGTLLKIALPPQKVEKKAASTQADMLDLID